jgi:hypothetical protein
MGSRIRWRHAAGGGKVRHFAVVNNIREWKASRLIEWHREKAGTIEGVHDVLKNELAAGVMPSKYFGRNAAWLRMAAIAHNVMTALKRLAHHVRRLVLRLATTAAWLADWLEAARLLPLRV